MNRKLIVRRVAIGLAAVVMMVLLLGMGGQETPVDLQLGERTTTAESTASPPPSLAEVQSSFRTVSQAALPVVVEVNITDVVQASSGSQSPFDYFFGNRNQGQNSQEYFREGLGSGVIVARSGNTVYVLTNQHVVGEADEIKVSLYDGREYKAKLVGGDEKKDLALISFETAEEVPLAVLGDSDSLMVGDWVLAVGNPFGFESTVTAGIVSALGRRTNGQYGPQGYTDFIQTDAAINQGNSGGALVNINGEVVGINSWIVSAAGGISGGGNVGLGFAIPINVAKSAIQDFIDKGSIEYGWLGVSLWTQTLTTQEAEQLKVGKGAGALLSGVYGSSPAAKAGVLPGDFVIAVGDKTVKDYTDLAVTVGNLKAGTQTQLKIIRGGTPMTLNVTIDPRPSDPTGDKLWPGFSTVTLTDAIRSQVGIGKGAGNLVVALVEESSPAASAGMQVGDVISSVNGKNAATLLDLYSALNGSNGRGQIDLVLVRQGKNVTVTLRK